MHKTRMKRDTMKVMSGKYVEFISAIDNVMDADTGLKDYLSSIVVGSIGFIRLSYDIVRSLLSRSVREQTVAQIYLMLKIYEVQRKPVIEKLTHPLNGADYLFEDIANALKTKNEGLLFELFYKSHVMEVISQFRDFEEDKRNNKPNIFDESIKEEVIKKLNFWDDVYKSKGLIGKDPNQTTILKLWSSRYKKLHIDSN